MSDKKPQLPPQQSINDTTNWENRPFIAPDGKPHILNESPKIIKVQNVQNTITKNIPNLKQIKK